VKSDQCKNLKKFHPNERQFHLLRRKDDHPYDWVDSINPDKSEALIIGTTNQLQVATGSLSSVTVAAVDLPVADETKV